MRESDITWETHYFSLFHFLWQKEIRNPPSVLALGIPVWGMGSLVWASLGSRWGFTELGHGLVDLLYGSSKGSRKRGQLDDRVTPSSSPPHHCQIQIVQFLPTNLNLCIYFELQVAGPHFLLMKVLKLWYIHKNSPGCSLLGKKKLEDIKESTKFHIS